MNILLLTSCNRIKQVLLSLSLNHYTIKDTFSAIIVDNSTPEISDPNYAEKMHESEDPYNMVKSYNFNADIKSLYDAKKYFPKIKDYIVIRCNPRIAKQRGEATMIALGLMQASLVGDRVSDKQNYCIKLTGTSILKYDIFDQVKEGLKNKSIMTWHRTNIGGYERSTRIFACKPEKMVGMIANRGWYDWVDDNSGILEQRWARYITNDLGENNINYTARDDASVLLEGGMAMQQSYGREWITNFIETNNIKDSNNPYIEEFLNGGIW